MKTCKYHPTLNTPCSDCAEFAREQRKEERRHLATFLYLIRMAEACADNWSDSRGETIHPGVFLKAARAMTAYGAGIPEKHSAAAWEPGLCPTCAGEPNFLGCPDCDPEATTDADAIEGARVGRKKPGKPD